MRAGRLYHSARLLLCRTPRKRAKYLKDHDLLGGIGENCMWGPWLLPLYPKLIKLHDNVHVHKTAHLVPHDMLNRFLATCEPGADFGFKEKLGCIELMDNVYVAMNVTVMPNVRINRNCIISAGSVVTSDIPENSIASGIPAKPTGRFDMFVALRKMGKGQTVAFKNQELPDELATVEWERFLRRHNGD
ncbi:MAG: acyltransferase [Ruminococcaceae bacterium]|jgi:acetyltransferase-like isoleucine patch superfamily enzyme|nr:acyltransferase [Oscillospiraceae bacterium]